MIHDLTPTTPGPGPICYDIKGLSANYTIETLTMRLLKIDKFTRSGSDIELVNPLPSEQEEDTAVSLLHRNCPWSTAHLTNYQPQIRCPVPTQRVGQLSAV